MKILDIITESESASKLKRRVLAAIDRLDDADPRAQELMNYLKSNIFSENFERAWDDAQLNSRARPVAIKWFKELLEHARVPLENKIKLLKSMSDSANLIPKSAFTNNSSGDVLSLLSNKIKSNPAFEAVAQPTWLFKIGGQGGMGPAELFFALFSENGSEGSGKKGGDVSVDGWKIELKKGGVIPPGSTGKRVVDSLNTELLATARREKFIDQLDTGTKTSFSSGWIPEFFKIYTELKGQAAAEKVLKNYLVSLYDDQAGSYVNSVYQNLGTTQADKSLAPLIFAMYKESHGWDSICFVNDSFKYINFTDFGNLPGDLKYHIVLKRGKGDVSDIQSGGDTNAVADGYLIVDLARQSGSGGRGTRAPKTARPSKSQPVKLDPKLFQQQSQEKQAAISAEQQFSQMVQSNPSIAQAWRQIPADEKADAQEDIIDLLAQGGTADQVVNRLNSWLAENQLKHIRKMIK